MPHTTPLKAAKMTQITKKSSKKGVFPLNRASDGQKKGFRPQIEP